MKTILWVLSMVYGLPSFPAWKTLTEDELESRWLLLRSIEWINWPLFISQSVVPPLLWFYEWQPVVVAVIVITTLWRLAIATRCVSVKLVELGPLFVGLKFLICPIMALLIWWQGDRVGAVVALLWPVAVLLLELSLNNCGLVVAAFARRNVLRAEVEAVQKRLAARSESSWVLNYVKALGYTRRTPSPDEVLKGEREKAKEYPFGEESPNLPQWQLDELTRHRRLRQRSSQSADPGKIIWTRTSKGAAVTELDGYWADVAVTEEKKFALAAYSKDSGLEVITWFDYETEQQAMHAAVDFMRDGKDPRARMPEKQPKTTKTKLGYEKATATYLAGEGDTDYKRHMKHWYGQMKAILSDESNPQAAAELCATLEEEYTSVTMSDWDKHQIAKLLRK